MRLPSGLICGSLAASSEKRSRGVKLRLGPSGAAAGAPAGSARPASNKAAQIRFSMFVPPKLADLCVRAAFAKRRHFVERADLVDHRRPLRGEELGDGAAEVRVGDEMRRPGRHGPIAAAQLVLALRPRLDLGEAAVDRSLDRLIIADLE